MHVARIRSSHVTRDGQRRDYESVYLRQSYRDGGKVKHRQLANLSALPQAALTAIEAVLDGQQLVPAAGAVTVARSLPHGHVAAVSAQAGALGLPELLGPPCRARDLAHALVVSRVARPGSKLATRAWWGDTTLGVDLGVAGASTDEIYAAMDWLVRRQDSIEAELARRHLSAGPGSMALFDLSSSWMEGTCCPLAARGYSRDGKKGRPQIEYGLLTDPDGRPVAVRVFKGNTGDPTAFIEAADVVRNKFELTELVMVGDRGMITAARIDALKQDALNDLGGLGWLTSLRAPAIAKLAADDGPLQMSLFDQVNFAEFAHPDYPGERLIACRNPLLAVERARKRQALLAATEKDLAPVMRSVKSGRLKGADKIGQRAGKLIGKHKMAKHFEVTITDTSLTVTRKEDAIAAEAALDGIYVIRTSVTTRQLDSAGVVFAYKNLANVERDFRIIKADDLDLRPIHHRLEDRVRAHVLICMLAAYLTWHLRKAWTELTYTDSHPPTRTDPVAPTHRSRHADLKAGRRVNQDGLPLHTFNGLLDHLATLTRNDLQFGPNGPVVPTLTQPTPIQRKAFQLLTAAIPQTIK